MSETTTCDTGDVVLELVNIDADVITLPPKKVGKSREITLKKKEYAV